MLRNLLKNSSITMLSPLPQSVGASVSRSRCGLLWTLCVAAVGFINWYADFVAQRPINMIGLVIHCVLAGLIGLVILTKIEMWLEPWRFFDE